MDGKGKQVIIVGAGPGGLTAAIALREVGFEPVVFERAAEMQQTGTSLTLWPNAITALSNLGISDPVRSISLPLAGIAMRSWRGELLFNIATAERFECLSGGYAAAVSRWELLRVLFEALGKATVKLGSRCVDYKQDEDGVTAFFDDDVAARGCLLIGADGIKSITRTRLAGEKKLRYAGFCVWRGVAEFELKEKVGLTSIGRGAQFGIFPMIGNRVYWFASASAREGENDWPVGRKRELLERFRGWHEPINSIIEATDESSILRNDIYDQDPLRKWSDGRVTLLGDAAHPAIPTLGQGACQAIEDAVVLAACLRRESNVVRALKSYESLRMKRTSSITLESRRMGRMGQWKSPLVCWLRDKLIQRTPDRIRTRQLNRLFQFEQ
jgi:2-polyprenyl-6-methoxyphenol hydroxylase-like FAD-dependent oxidoreductase